MRTELSPIRMHGNRAARRIALAAIVLLATAACGSNEPTAGPVVTMPPALANPLPVVRLNVEPFAVEYYSGFTTTEVRVVRDQAAFEIVWAQLFGRQTDRPALPVIDFEREMVAVAALGQRNTGGFGIAIDSAFADSDGGTTFALRTSSPGAGCFVTMALTAPADVARLPRRDGAVRVRQTNVVTACR